MSVAAHIGTQLSYTCVGLDAEATSNTRDLEVAAFYFAEVHCIGVNFPPYGEGSELYLV